MLWEKNNNNENNKIKYVQLYYELQYAKRNSFFKTNLLNLHARLRNNNGNHVPLVVIVAYCG